MSSYDRWKLDEPERDTIEECECSQCGEWLGEIALNRLRERLADCETYEDEQNVEAGAMCSRCQAKEDGDGEE